MPAPDPAARRRLPSVDALLRSEPGRRAAATFGRPLLKRTITAAAGQGEGPDADAILAAAVAAAARAANGPIAVVNATGVLLHTGLGRAPLPEAAIVALERAARGATDLELDLATGGRGRRSARAETLLTAITGAEAALVVNNGAAALLLALAALAKGRGVLVSRGELVEIGGGFRIPDILAASGAKLVEVGTTNRTRLADFRDAWTDRTALVLKVHPSNYRIVGFAEAPTAKQLATLAASRGVPFVHDLGSGLLEPGRVADEPSVAEALDAGVDLALFSGDKLLGGAQAGIAVGRADLIARMRTHPIARAVRVDKLQIAALEAVLVEHVAGRRDDLPVWRMLREPVAAVRARARALADGIPDARVVASTASVGGGSLPGGDLPSAAVRIEDPSPDALAARLRTGRPAVLARVDRGAVLLDCRTIADDEVDAVVRAVRRARIG
ncbi:MAG: L-seryl-tRNA(Sec) selenium transferase [Actinomycetota bacterium]